MVGRDHLHGWGQKKSAKMALDVDGPYLEKGQVPFPAILRLPKGS